MRKLLLYLLLVACYSINAQNVTKNCKSCGKPIAQCKFQGNHPKEKTCITCGKLISKCFYRGKHPSPNDPTIGTSTYVPTTKTITINGVSFDMVEVQGGTFRMGATTEQCKDHVNSEAKPVHSVTLSNYYIGKYEVTQDLWEAVMGTNPVTSKSRGAKKPICYISWNDILAFLTQLNRLSGYSFRLPTEAEWEFAARGGTKSKGFIYSGSNNPNDVMGHDIQEVGLYKCNELGLYDMSGNIIELCSDWYGDYMKAEQIDPSGPQVGKYKVRRGGGNSSWIVGGTTSYRSQFDLGIRSNMDGFRLVISPESLNNPLPLNGKENGREWINLGLSVKWATCNVGASSPEFVGHYFAWGESKSKSAYLWGNCFDCLDSSTGSSWDVYKLGGKTEIKPTSGQDTAHENWGGKWRMPTNEEVMELCTKCKWVWTTLNDSYGYKIIGPNGNSIFLPSSGVKDVTRHYFIGEQAYYWTSTLSSTKSSQADIMYFNESKHYASSYDRRYGISVRPVME